MTNIEWLDKLWVFGCYVLPLTTSASRLCCGSSYSFCTSSFSPFHSYLWALSTCVHMDIVPQSISRLFVTLPHTHSPPSFPPSHIQEEDRVVVLRFGHDYDETCMQMDEVSSSTTDTEAFYPYNIIWPTILLIYTQILASVADKIKNFAVIYLVDISEVSDFNAMYELYDPCTVMFFFRNKVRVHEEW